MLGGGCGLGFLVKGAWFAVGVFDMRPELLRLSMSAVCLRFNQLLLANNGAIYLNQMLGLDDIHDAVVKQPLL